MLPQSHAIRRTSCRLTPGEASAYIPASMQSADDSATVLIVDDDGLVVRALAAALRRHFHVLTADGGERALAVLADHPDTAVAIIDQRMPGMSGAELIRQVADPYPHLVRIILTGFQDIESLKQAINHGGAFRYLDKPCPNEELIAAVQAGIALHRRLREGARAPAVLAGANAALRDSNERLWLENLHLRDEVARSRTSYGPLVGSSPALRRAIDEAERMADSDATVLILGETGSGKELFARYIHDRSRRATAIFRAQNCASVSEQLAEDTLFGHIPGAFTGARNAKKGLFEIADGGTLFLDEVAECSPSLQARLLRVVEDKIIYRLGDDEQALRVDVRLIAATHRDLLAEAKAGRFREDLYYRLNVFCLRLPPLRERRSDVAELARHFVDSLNQRGRTTSGKYVLGLTPEALRILESHDYPGNVRELANVVERAWLFADDADSIGVEHVVPGLDGGDRPRVVLNPSMLNPSTPEYEGLPWRDAVGRFKSRLLADALTTHAWNVAATARALGISRTRLYEEMRECGLERPPD